MSASSSATISGSSAGSSGSESGGGEGEMLTTATSIQGCRPRRTRAEGGWPCQSRSYAATRRASTATSTTSNAGSPVGGRTIRPTRLTPTARQVGQTTAPDSCARACTLAPVLRGGKTARGSVSRTDTSQQRLGLDEQHGMRPLTMAARERHEQASLVDANGRALDRSCGGGGH